MFQILIADDNANTRRLFEVVLSQNGFDVLRHGTRRKPPKSWRRITWI